MALTGLNDLALDPVTNDLLITSNDLSIVEGADRVRQNLDIKLKLWTGDWFLDTDFGTPYLNDILGKQITLNGAIAALKDSILAVNDVSAITSFNYNYSRSARTLTVDFECSTSYGLIRAST